MVSEFSESSMKKEENCITLRPRKRRFQCIYDYGEDSKAKFVKKEIENGLEDSLILPTFPQDEFRKSLENLHEHQVWVNWKEEIVKQDFIRDKRLKEKDETIQNLAQRIVELEGKFAEPACPVKAEESVAVKNLLCQINHLQEESDSLNNEIKYVKRTERSWASKYWKLYKCYSGKENKSSCLQCENTDKDWHIKKLQEENRFLVQENQRCKENRARAEQRFKQRIQKLRQGCKDIHTELFDEKNKHLDLMFNYKPMVIIENPKKSSNDDDCLEILNEQVCSIKRAFLNLKQMVSGIPSNTQRLVTATTLQIQNAVQETDDKYIELFPRYKREIELRKKYHNELVELRGNIRVLCRIRPHRQSSEEMLERDAVPCVSVDSFDDCNVKVNAKGRVQDFDFDKVFQESATQFQVFDEVNSLVTSVLDGFNVCIFAFGQTGSGKTYTMEGPANDPGINQRALKLLFEEAESSSWSYSIEASVLEVYNETIRDLLNSDASVKLEVKLKPEGGLHVPGLVSLPVTSLEEANQIFCLGRRNRATEATNMNEHSSRSHCLLCVKVTGVNPVTGSKSFGRLNLVDLAGSERLSKTQAEGSRLKEAQNINKSLSCLGDVINALKNKHNHIPYRNSKLTYLLQESLGGDSKTLMILQVSPEENDASETVCTLTFGQRVRSTELGAATKRVEEGGGNGKGTPSSLRRGADNSVKTTPTIGGSASRPQNLAKSCSTFGKQARLNN